MLTINHLLEIADVPVTDVTVLLHTPGGAKLRRILPWIAAEHPMAFNAYQGTHGGVVEATVKRRPLIASFVSLGDGTLAFVGLYRKIGARHAALDEIDALPQFVEIGRLTGVATLADAEAGDAHGGRILFDLALMDEMAEFAGRLVISAPPGRNYGRLAENLVAPVVAIEGRSRLVPTHIDWRELVMGTAEMRAAPSSLRATLKQWRGVYLAIDKADGGRYVGSAAGVMNMWSRWSQHIEGETGVTAGLLRRRTDGLCFSVLDLMSPADSVGEVVERETTWKNRLHTREFGLNEN